ncbi:MAG: gamma-glutamyltransferase family protein [Haloarculaceae archaeon]
MDEPDVDTFHSRRSTMYAPNGMVATSQPLAASAGVDVLRDGGNAFDAAVATAAVLNVTEPTSTGLGGDVFMLYRTADGEVGAMQACGGAPGDATVEALRERVAEQEGVDPAAAEMPERGPHAVTVPGTARGWEATVREFGRRSLADVLQPAIDYAVEGYPVTPVIADAWQHQEDVFVGDHARATYLFDGAAPSTGQHVRLPELGESLRAVAEEGADVVYQGHLGEAIVEELQSRGGLMTTDDLRSFEVAWPDPVSTTYRGAEVYELPPNNQGLVAIEALNIAAELDAGAEPYDSPERVHRFAEALKLAFHDGHHYITDPDYRDVPDLGSTAYARERAREVGETANREVTFGVPGARAEDADTVLLTATDDAGNVVSYINSRFMGFGSGLVAGDTGIALQNRGASFSLDPDHPNRVEPGKRPFHTLIPGVAKFGPDDWAAFGVMGGYMQPQGHLQVLSNVLDYDMSLQTALDMPRWRYRENGQLAVEPHFDGDVANGLVRRGHEVVIQPPAAFGGAQVTRNDGGVVSGATEPRKDGEAVGY